MSYFEIQKQWNGFAIFLTAIDGSQHIRLLDNRKDAARVSKMMIQSNCYSYVGTWYIYRGKKSKFIGSYKAA